MQLSAEEIVIPKLENQLLKVTCKEMQE